MDISVIIPTYRPADYLWKCLDSLCSQTLDHAAYEIILVLNGEKGMFFSGIENYISMHKDTTIRLLYTEKSGVSNARNIGIDNASGRFLCFIDDDDWVSESYLESLLASAKADGVVFADIRYYYEDSDRYQESYISRVVESNRQRRNITLLSARRLCNSACGKIISRNVIGNARFDENYKISEDTLFMATISKDIASFCLANRDAIYYRRVRQKSATFSRHPIGRLVKNNISLTWKMMTIYLSAPHRYSIPFFFLQSLALMKNLVRIVRGIR